MKPILIIAGESSGERYGADVVREFGRGWPGYSFFGVGGRRMAEAGVDLLFSIDELSAVGIFEVIGRLPHFRRIFRSIEREVDARRPAAALLIDSPDFNLRLARKLKASGIPVVYYISPTVWAWRRRRLKAVRESVDRMLLIFPFEEEIYNEQGIPVTFVGHPLIDKVAVKLSREEFLGKHGLRSDLPIVGLLPGSRPTELRNHLPAVAGAVERLAREMDLQFVLVLAESLGQNALGGFFPPDEKRALILTEDAYEAMAYSSLVLSACGTANLEAAILGTPLVAFYRLSPFTYYPFRRLVKISDYSIVNILARKRVVPELIQGALTPERLAAEARSLLLSEGRRSAMRAEFAALTRELGRGPAALNVATALAQVLGAPQSG